MRKTPMTDYSIPEWFFKEHSHKDIWKQDRCIHRVSSEIAELERGVEQGWKETQVQSYLKPRPCLFDGLFHHGHGTFLSPELSFGGTYRVSTRGHLAW
jgi:hypothetical protein